MDMCPDCRAGKRFLTRTQTREHLLNPEWQIECERCGFTTIEQTRLPGRRKPGYGRADIGRHSSGEKRS